MARIFDGKMYRGETPKEESERLSKGANRPVDPDPLETLQSQLDENTLALAELMYGGDSL